MESSSPVIGCTIYVIKGTRIYHREDGPAAEWDNGDTYWYINGKQVYCKSLEEFQSSLEFKTWKLRAFI